MENPSYDEWVAAYRSKLHELRDQFDVRVPVARGVLSRAELVLRKGVADYGLKCDVSSRLKGFDSFRLKFRKKYLLYLDEYTQAENHRKDWFRRRLQALLADPFSEITDMIGIRCIGLFSSELYPFERQSDEAFAQSIDSEGQSDFFVLQELISNRFSDSGKIGIRPAPRADEKLSRTSGYRSVHYDLCLKADCIVSSLEQEYLAIPFELQVRTYSQHMVDDVSHFLSYKSDDVFFPSERFRERTASLQNDLVRIQEEIDTLFEESRQDFKHLSKSLKNGHADKLLVMRITPDTLKLYAIYEFVVLRQLDVPEVPEKEEDAQFSDLWLHELSDGLNAAGLGTIQDVQNKTREGLPFVDEYARSQRTRKSVFKKNDLTDILSKCLLFSIDSLRSSYPVLEETKSRIEAFKTKMQET